jgi:hypothetical protein
MEAKKLWENYITELEPQIKTAIAEAKEEDVPFLQQCFDGVKNEVSSLLTATDEEKKKRHLVNIENYQAIITDHKAVISIRFGNILCQAISTGLTIAMKAVLGVLGL